MLSTQQIIEKLTLTPEEADIVNAQLSRNFEQELNPQKIQEYTESFENIVKENVISQFDNTSYYSQLGNILREKNLNDIALYAYINSLKIDIEYISSDYINSYVGLGRIFDSSGKTETALAFYNTAIALQDFKADKISNPIIKHTKGEKPNHPASSVASAYYHKALMLYNNGKIDEALKNLEEALKFNSGYVSVYLQKAYIFENLNDFKQSIENYDKVVELTKYSSYEDIGISAYYHKARVYYKELTDNPSDQSYLNNAINAIASCDQFIKHKLEYELDIEIVKNEIDLFYPEPEFQYNKQPVKTGYHEAYSLKQKIFSSINENESNYYGALAAYYLNDYVKAIELFDLAEKYIDTRNYNDRILCACMKGQAYSAIDETKALYYFEKASLLIEELNKQSNSNNFKKQNEAELKNLTVKKDLIDKLKDLHGQTIEVNKLPKSQPKCDCIDKINVLENSIIKNLIAQVMLNRNNYDLNKTLLKQVASVMEMKNQIPVEEEIAIIKPLEELNIDDTVPVTEQSEELMIVEFLGNL